MLLGVLPAVLLIAGGVYVWINDDGAGTMAAGAVVALVGLLLLIVSMLILQAMRGVFGVALYRFASTGEVTTGFTEADLNSAVRTKLAAAEQARVVGADPVDAERREALDPRRVVDGPGDHRDARRRGRSRRRRSVISGW